MRERDVEVPWVSARIIGNRVLDVGCGEGELAAQLAREGYRVYGIDTKETNLKHPNFTFCKEDITCTCLPDVFFDCVYAISTLEHVGLGFYGDPIRSEGDRKAVAQIRRVTKPDGIILITLPFGARAVAKRDNRKFYRVYDQEALMGLFEDLNIAEMQYFIKQGDIWRKSHYEEVKGLDSASTTWPKALVCLKAVLH